MKFDELMKAESVVDERIVALNNIIGEKIPSSTPSSERKALRELKLKAKYIIDHWDDVNSLLRISNDLSGDSDSGLLEIIRSRVEQIKK